MDREISAAERAGTSTPWPREIMEQPEAFPQDRVSTHPGGRVLDELNLSRTCGS